MVLEPQVPNIAMTPPSRLPNVRRFPASYFQWAQFCASHGPFQRGSPPRECSRKVILPQLRILLSLRLVLDRNGSSFREFNKFVLGIQKTILELQTLNTKSCCLYKCAGPIAETRPVPAFFLIFDLQRHNDPAKLRTWPVLLPFPKEIDCIKCVVWLRIKEIEFSMIVNQRDWYNLHILHIIRHIWHI